MPETRQCPNCGVENDVARSLCKNCLTPLTAYSGQLTGSAQEGNLADQVDKLDSRPPSVTAMVLFEVIFAIFWPFASVVGAFASRPTTNAEGTNYLAAAFGSVGPILSAIVLIPLGIAFLVLAGLTWTQRSITWQINLGVLGLFALVSLLKFGSSPIMGVIGLVVAGVLAFLWLRADTKAWFGIE